MALLEASLLEVALLEVTLVPFGLIALLFEADFRGCPPP